MWRGVGELAGPGIPLSHRSAKGKENETMTASTTSSLPSLYQTALQNHQQGDLQTAENLYRQILEASPHDAPALHGRGLIAYQLGQYEIALTHVRQAIDASPDYFEARKTLGAILRAAGRLEEALATYDELLRLQPHYPEALANRGNVLKAMGRASDAEASYREALAQNPEFALAHQNLGLLLQDQGRHREAVACHQLALRFNPNSADPHQGLGSAFGRLGEYDAAIHHFREALRLNPHIATGHHNLATALKLAGRLDESLACFENAVRLKPDYALAHMNRATVLLQVGDLERGWREYEWRWHVPDSSPRRFPQPIWDGKPLQGRTILLHAEQGMGDVLQFIRYAQLVRDSGGRVVVSCPGLLLKLLSRCRGIDQLVDQKEPLPGFDVHAPLVSLPGLFNTTLKTIPAEVPYLFADPTLVEKWHQRLASIRSPKVGVCWQGNPENPGDQRRSFPLADLEPLSRVARICLVSLQQGPGVEQIATSRFPILTLGDDFDREAGAFMDTAAVMKSLDLVVSADTAVAHLAGGLGVPLWLPLARWPDWRWLLDRDDTPWYPTMRLFRQQEPGNWSGVFERIAAGVQSLKGTGAPISIPVSPGELLDKIAILSIKCERITDSAKLDNVKDELRLLQEASTRAIENTDRLRTLTVELRAVNEALWDIEDAIRRCEADRKFGPEFIELARSVYRQNDQRARLKKEINELLGSTLVEEKQYVPYRDES
jgi:tetratricopeptide (TPR) repeat protein